MRTWLGMAILSASWLFGLGLYDLPSPAIWLATVAAGTLLLWRGGAEKGTGIFSRPLWAEKMSQSPARGQAASGRWATPATIVLLLPAAWLLPGAYRAGPLLLAGGLALGLVPAALASPRPDRRAMTSLAAAAVTAGLVLIVEGAAVALYVAGTARAHDACWPIPQLLAGLMSWLGAETTASGPCLVVQTMRQTHRLAASWDMVFEPGLWCFFVGGLAWLGLRSGPLALRERARVRAAGANSVPAPPAPLPAGEGRVSRGRAWLRAAALMALAIACWLPVRAALMIALYLHRVLRFPDDWPLHAMNHFFSPWVSLGLLLVPALLTWRLLRLAGGTGDGGEQSRGESPDDGASADVVAATLPARPWQLPLAAGLALAGAGLLAAAFFWTPTGARKPGRIKWVERHSTWSPTTAAYDTKTYGEKGSYNYAAAYRFLGQFYEMSQLLERDKIDADALAACDVLVIKIPDSRYSPAEADAVVRFVRQGGGLLLIGDHTNLDRSSAYMNDISRWFGFTFRDDLLFGSESSPYEERCPRAALPHPAAAHVPWFDFAVSCSVDPGWSRAEAVILQSGLWSMPPDYHMENYHPVPQHCPEMRYGSFIQAWAARSGRGRALAWGDSTIFSNFCLFQPGKSELLLNMLEWLNHRNAAVAPFWLLLPPALLLLGGGIWLGLRRGAGWLLLPAAALGGWTIAGAAVVVAGRVNMPLPRPVDARQQPCVSIDRTASRVPLARGAFNEDEHGFGMFEQWIPRLGYCTARGQGAAVFSGRALVMIQPTQPADEEYRRGLVEYVAGGGRLLVLDSPDSQFSTAAGLLRPFGMSFSRRQPRQGVLALAGSWPALAVDRAWEVVGGEPVAWLDKRPVGAQVRYGKGLVIALGCASLWDDARMGGHWSREPEGDVPLRYEALYALLRLLVEDRPIAVPQKRKTIEIAPRAPAGGSTPGRGRIHPGGLPPPRIPRG